MPPYYVIRREDGKSTVVHAHATLEAARKHASLCKNAANATMQSHIEYQVGYLKADS